MVLVLAGAAACHSSDGGLAARAGASAPDDTPSTCQSSTNPIDVAACPRLLEDGCAAWPRATPRELCRRLFLDLTGVGPTDAEIAATCAGRDARDIARTLMQTPAYVKHAEELWAEKLAYDPAQVDGKWLADADRLVDAMVTGAMAYDTFARRIAAHPVMGIGARLPRSDVVEDDASFTPQVGERLMRLFLGRPPIAGESESFARLFRPWKKNIVVLNGDYGRAEVLLDPGMCPCTSTVLGRTTSIELPLAGPIAYEDASSDVRAELEKPGELLVGSGAFDTQAVDLALAMYLGWWKSTTNLDASTLPEVEVALAQRFRAQRSWPELVLDIVTSALYVRSSHAPSGARDDAPAWCTGPLRIVRPEELVSTLGHLLGPRVGRCDHRTYEPRDVYYPDGSEGAFFPYALREDEDSDVALFGTRDFHLQAAGAMGGCVAGAPRTESPTLAAAFGMPDTVATICAAAARGLANETAATAGDRFARLLLGRPLGDGEQRALAQDVAEAQVTDGEGIAALACAALARTIDFGTY